MKSDEFLILFASCIIVKGASRATICDLQRGYYAIIPNDFADILKMCAFNTLKQMFQKVGKDNEDVLHQYINFVLENELGFITNEPSSFPPIDSIFEVPNKVSNSIIEVSNKTLPYLPYIKEQLNILGCLALQLRVYININHAELVKILDLFNGTRLRHIDIGLQFNSEFNPSVLKKLSTQYQRLSLVIVHSALKNCSDEYNHGFKSIFTTKTLDFSQNCGLIGENLFSCNLTHYLESQHFNTCLNKKISIDKDGFIKNCPSMEKSYGNIKSDTLIQVVTEKEFEQVQRINKDQIKVCKDCEFRHICTDCRVFIKDTQDILSKPEKCLYDPYTTIWEEE